MFYYVILSFIIVVAFVIIFSTWMRKKTYNKIDRYEAWKMDIMNRPVTEEISKVKELKMIGEAEKKFEKWRADWDEIVTTELPLIEESLFDAEGYVDHYRFKKAEKTLDSLEDHLNKIEARIRNMLSDLNKVVESEHANRKDILIVKDMFLKGKKDLITKRSQYRGAVNLLEEKLKVVEKELQHYEDETNNGNYIKARDILLSAKASMEELNKQFEKIPSLYNEIHHTIPDLMQDLRMGFEEMTSQGYVLRHLQINVQLEEIKHQLNILDQAVGKMELKPVEESINIMHEQVDHLFEQMETEVISRKKLLEVAPTIERDLTLVGENVKSLAAETETIQSSYHIDEEDLRMQHEIDDIFNKLDKEYQEVFKDLQEQKEAFSVLLEKLVSMRSDIEVVQGSAKEFKDKIKTLRKDELIAKETMQKLKRTIFDCRRKVQKSNLPGVPEYYITLLDDSEEALADVNHELDQSPLNMVSVQRSLDDAVEKVNEFYKKTQEMMDNAALSEELIQYGNRYRSDSREINEELNHAETLFRSYNYQEAVEVAVKAIEKKEPKILKRMELYSKGN
ncbi:septation ring formation regulator EzrA [Terrilactibacillus laevilacticus]|uniref:Septation ring formation regulator EzrA n=1 Tax=Terrilactibacillus laevilacticus TaxID=1380157 RepID=A0ABW5PTC7_9BACI|nr:septation ring formation regulator EzrA [Terrilactibacillus laevilacticus]